MAESTGARPQQWIILTAAVILAIVVVMNMRRRRGPEGSTRPYRRETDSANHQSAMIRRDVEQLLVELEEMSRTINARIETHFAKLERSITDADERIAALRALLDGREQPSSSAESSPTNQRQRRIFELADQGRTPLEIAQTLQESVGEVELILNLRKAKNG